MKDKIAHIVDSFLTDSSYFLVEVRIVNETITVYLDGFNGIDVRQCSKVARHINAVAEDDEEMAQFFMEVTSCGIGYDINNHKQLLANVGRIVGITTSNSSNIEGRLVGVDEAYVYLKREKELTGVLQKEIEKAAVEIEF